MKVGWLQDTYNWAGGAELTIGEFRGAAPESVEIVDCPPGDVQKGMDAYVVGNCVQYQLSDLAPLRGRPTVKYCNDIWPHGDPQVRTYLLQNAKLAFCSPLHLKRFPHEHNGGEIIPPPVDLAPFRKHGGHKPAAKREGTCWVGMGFYGKGIQEALEWAELNGSVDFYGGGPLFPPNSQLARIMGPVPNEELPKVLADYERFLFLPTHIEPFARSVIEAWAAGCKLIVNRNIGALHYIENPDELEGSIERFWRLVSG
jgi:glycosyltransferase involved in cell wall biosynthesis